MAWHAIAHGAEAVLYWQWRSALAESVPVTGKWLKGTAHIWAERLKILEPDKTIAISFYGKSNGWLDDQVSMAFQVRAEGGGLSHFQSA
jgi:hypothetical protein